MGKKKYNTFHLNIRFSNGSSMKKAQLEPKIKSWIKFAERMFNEKPGLKIKPEYKWKTKVKNDLVFEKRRDASKFMDNKFDNIVGSKKTQGYLQVLIVDSVEVDGTSLAGRSFFPHKVTPFRRKYGILLVTGIQKGTFSHELGHSFGLKHTFERYISATCNKGYPKGDKGKGGTRKKTRTGYKINLMDYCKQSGDKEFLNDCQEKRAAKQRRTYMTRSGETNYRKLKGLR